MYTLTVHRCLKLKVFANWIFCSGYAFINTLKKFILPGIQSKEQASVVIFATVAGDGKEMYLLLCKLDLKLTQGKI